MSLLLLFHGSLAYIPPATGVLPPEEFSALMARGYRFAVQGTVEKFSVTVKKENL